MLVHPTVADSEAAATFPLIPAPTCQVHTMDDHKITHSLTCTDRPPRDQLPLPTRPPYTAHLGNLSFDVTMADIEDFFAGCETTNVRIVEDKIERKPKGFGYVEFGSLDGLKKALELNGSQFQGRGVRISVAEPRT